MLDHPSSPVSPVVKFFQNQVSPWLALLYQLVAILAFLIYPLLAFNWVRTPFLGSFVEHTLFFNNSTPARAESWELSNAHLPAGARLIEIDGARVQNPRQMIQVLRAKQFGDVADLTIQLPGGQQHIKVTLRHFPALDQFGYFLVPYLTGLIYLVSGLWVFRLRRRSSSGRAFAMFATAVAICVAGLFDVYTTNILTYLWTFSFALGGGALFNLALLFPEESLWVVRFPTLRWVGYILALALAAFSLPTIYNQSDPQAYLLAWRLEFIFSSLMFLFFLLMSFYRRYQALSPIVREQGRFILWGFAFSFALLGVWLLLKVTNPALAFTPYLLLPLAAFPVLIGYAILRYRLLNTDYLLSRAMLYSLLTLLTVIGYALLVTGLSQVFGNALQPASPFVVGFLVFGLALLLNPLRNRLQGAIDAAFFRGQVVYRTRLQSFGRELTQAIGLPSIVILLRRYVENSLLPSQLHIFVHDPLSDHYVAVPGENSQPTTDLRFPFGCGLVKEMTRQHESIFLADMDSLPPALQPDAARLAVLGCQLFVPLPGRQKLIGWLSLAARRSGEPYTNQDLGFLESLGDQAALAVERAQVVADLERRVHEMNVLARVAQGTNFTLAFDDILELIYAQTNQIIPTRDFRITLYDRSRDTLSHVFFLEDDERFNDRENRPLPDGQGLEAQVILGQRFLITDDYERECRARGVLMNEPGIIAWMGVPLIAGAETIGTISLGSRDPAVFYTDEQRNLLQAIADQASGAIVKARLLQETEHRARQLATLNEIGRSLTSTLEPKLLLNKILQSAVDILNCQAGSLFLVEEQTGELVFEVVLGPVASDLLGQRLPSGTGMVGKAVESKKAIIANDAKRRKEWFDQTDQKTGFDTQDLLVVPMLIHERVIGVIEVINKADGAPFNQSDQELLTTFTSQATIAMENARLYTLTDQALAERVEELSVMQRIDQELNASLDVGRAMRITLEWAMRISGAEAGFMGVIEDEYLRVMTSEGYTNELAKYQDVHEKENIRLPIEMTALCQAVATGEVQSSRLENPGRSGDNGKEPVQPVYSLLTGACSQVVAPIRREAQVTGVLLLESRGIDTVTEDEIEFLSRLTDHAAIAIANAQLYSEVQAANLAKSKFVSFVAHELKNPMASIKGYTELVSGGMAGPINDMQKTFLGTVRSNVDRMNTIVSDLNDLTKIQVGSLKLEYKSVQVRDVLEEVIRSLRRQIDEKEQLLVSALPEDLPMVWVDQLRMGQILTNLVSNAHKYTPARGEIRVGAESWMELPAGKAGLQAVHIWVQDSGIGIAPEDQPKIFQQYFRTDVSKEMASGTGLGLNIVKSLVEMQGGRIWFESEPEKGSIFHFTLPVAETA